MKKLALTIALLAPVAASAGNHTGGDYFYGGALLGLSSMGAELSVPGATLKNHDNSIGFVPGVYLGYRTDLDNGFFVAGETDLIIGSGEASLGYATIERKYMMGFTALVGKDIGNDLEVYGRLGGHVGNYELNNSSQRLTVDSTEFGLALGGGIAWNMDEKVRLRADYRYTGASYKEGVESIDASDHMFSLGAEYRF